MSLPIILHRAVQPEIEEAARWYEDQRAGLGRDFLDAVDQVMSDITANPARFGFANADIREGGHPALPLRRLLSRTPGSDPSPGGATHGPRPRELGDEELTR